MAFSLLALLRFVGLVHDSPTKWFVEFKKEVKARSSEDESLDAVETFSELPVKLKTQLLHSLCEWQTDNVELFRSSIIKEEQEETDWVCSSFEEITYCCVGKG